MTSLPYAQLRRATPLATRQLRLKHGGETGGRAWSRAFLLKGGEAELQPIPRSPGADATDAPTPIGFFRKRQDFCAAV